MNRLKMPPRICSQHRGAHEACDLEAERIYVALCLFLVRQLASHGLDVSRLELGLAEATEAREVLDEALRRSEERTERWRRWRQELVARSWEQV